MARSKWKLINEINRFPSGKQNLFLEILQKRKISYAGQVLVPGDTCYYATMNPEFSATYPLDEALLDRISACVPAAQPDFLAALPFLNGIWRSVIWQRICRILHPSIQYPAWLCSREGSHQSG